MQKHFFVAAVSTRKTNAMGGSSVFKGGTFVHTGVRLTGSWSVHV